MRGPNLREDRNRHRLDGGPAGRNRLDHAAADPREVQHRADRKIRREEQSDHDSRPPHHLPPLESAPLQVGDQILVATHPGVIIAEPKDGRKVGPTSQRRAKGATSSVRTQKSDVVVPLARRRLGRRGETRSQQLDLAAAPFGHRGRSVLRPVDRIVRA